MSNRDNVVSDWNARESNRMRNEKKILKRSVRKKDSKSFRGAKRKSHKDGLLTSANPFSHGLLTTATGKFLHLAARWNLFHLSLGSVSSHIP